MLHSPGKLIGIGFVLVMTGFILPILMVMRLVEASFLLSFISHGTSVAGLFLGLIGASMYVGRSSYRKREYPEQDYRDQIFQDDDYHDQ